MGAKRKSGPGPRRRAEPGRPSGRRGPDPAEVAEEYLDDEVRRDEETDELAEEAEDIPSGTVVDQQVYEGLAENRAEPADPKRRSRQRSALSERTVPARRKSRAKTKR